MSELPTIAEAVRRIKAGELTPLELVERCLANIERYEDRVQAWVLVDAEGARRAAREIAASVAKDDDRVLLGIPVGVKDIVDMAGMPTLAGSPLRKGHVAQEDAPLVANLRRAGAIILGKTVTTEYACFDPPPTCNPWNLERTPGGSSSGSAAGVAVGMCMAAVGSQTGGSITRPASYCGVAGLKPTRGAIRLDGMVPVSFTLDHPGPIAPRVDDLRRMYTAMAEPERALPMNNQALEKPPAFVRLGGFFDSMCDAAVRDVLDAACERLTASGAKIERVDLPTSFADVHRMHRRVMAAEAAEYHRRQFAEHRTDYGRHVAELVEEGLALSAVDYAEALRHRETFREEFRNMVAPDSIALIPATTCTAPSRDSTGNPAFNSPMSYAGIPAVNIPCGLAEDGLPCGLQLVSSWPNTEQAVLAAAEWCERQINFRDHPPLE